MSARNGAWYGLPLGGHATCEDARHGIDTGCDCKPRHGNAIDDAGSGPRHSLGIGGIEIDNHAHHGHRLEWHAPQPEPAHFEETGELLHRLHEHASVDGPHLGAVVRHQAGKRKQPGMGGLHEGKDKT